MKGLLFALLIISIGIDVNAESFETKEVKISESVVLFDRDKSEISGDGVKQLQTIQHGSTEITGYASSEGSYDYNMDLSERRAYAVSRVLNRPSIVIGIGESDAKTPIDPLDRKVIIRVTTTELTYNPIFSVDGTLQGVLSHQLYNVIPVR